MSTPFISATPPYNNAWELAEAVRRARAIANMSPLQYLEMLTATNEAEAGNESPSSMPTANK